jgi:hypothetical protein
VEHEVYSAEPLHPPHVSSNLLGATVLGGLLGGFGGGALAVFTFRTMHLETGGMAIVTYPPTGIVIFAVAALSAIGTALATLLWEGDMLHFRPSLPADIRQEIANGAVAVAAPEASREALEQAGARIVHP